MTYAVASRTRQAAAQGAFALQQQSPRSGAAFGPRPAAAAPRPVERGPVAPPVPSPIRSAHCATPGIQAVPVPGAETSAAAPQARGPRPIPAVRRVAQEARRPIEPTSQPTSVNRPADTIDRREWDRRLQPQAAPMGQLAEARTQVLQPQQPAPVAVRLRGRLQAAIDVLLPSNSRKQADSQRIAAWLRDNGVVGMDAAGRDWVLTPLGSGSDRLERLGFLQAFPHLSAVHVQRLRQHLADRYSQQAEDAAAGAAQTPSMTRLVGDALPKARRGQL